MNKTKSLVVALVAMLTLMLVLPVSAYAVEPRSVDAVPYTTGSVKPEDNMMPVTTEKDNKETKTTTKDVKKDDKKKVEKKDEKKSKKVLYISLGVVVAVLVVGGVVVVKSRD